MVIYGLFNWLLWRVLCQFSFLISFVHSFSFINNILYFPNQKKVDFFYLVNLRHFHSKSCDFDRISTFLQLLFCFNGNLLAFWLINTLFYLSLLFLANFFWSRLFICLALSAIISVYFLLLYLWNSASAINSSTSDFFLFLAVPKNEKNQSKLFLKWIGPGW